MDKNRVVGQTKSVGFQVGVRRTFPISQERAWEFITSEEGLNLWLGEDANVILQSGQNYSTKTGTGEIRIVKPLQQLRLTWQKEGWEKPSTVQVRIIAKVSDKTTISFHQENLSNQNAREEMKVHWETVLEGIKERCLF
ncbi:SRPBCC family protein [Bacillus ndiopicus]|uniref:SRPBCC family protein n=1 Tax=Bacillus ndiopicus TaxID=1347368 RepID=UPI0005A773F2|nr:SRPBCC domain-containing protein [Bacillus ndiopicus]